MLTGVTTSADGRRARRPTERPTLVAADAAELARRWRAWPGAERRTLATEAVAARAPTSAVPRVAGRLSSGKSTSRPRWPSGCDVSAQ